MAIQLGSAAGIVTIDASGVQSGVATATTSLNSLMGVADRVGSMMNTVGIGMSAAITVPFTLATTSAISDATDLQSSLQQTKSVFGDNAQAIIDWANTATTQFGLTEQAAISGADVFGTMFTTMGIGGQTAVDMSTKLTGLASDMAAFKGVDPTEMLNDLQSGLVGRGQALAHFGIDLRSTTVDAEAMKLGFTKVNGTFTDAQLVQARYALIMAQTTTEQGYFASHTGDAVEAQTELNAQWTKALTTLGTDLLPIFTKLVQFLTWIVEGFQKLPQWVQVGIFIFIGLVAAIGPLLIAFAGLISFIGGIVGIATALGTLGITAASAAAGLGLVVTIVGTTIGALLGLLGSILLLAAGPALLYWAFSTNFMGISTTAQQLWAIIKYAFANGWNEVSQGASNGLSLLRDEFATYSTDISIHTRATTESLTGFLLEKWTYFTTEFMSIFEKWRSILLEKWAYLVYSLQRIFNIDWGQLGINMIMGIVNGIESAVGNLVAAATTAAQAAMNAIKSSLGIHSPSTVMFQIGMNTGLGFMQGLTQSMNANAIAQTVTRPVQNSTSSKQNITIQLGGGLKINEANALLSAQSQQLMQELAGIMVGGGR